MQNNVWQRREVAENLADTDVVIRNARIVVVDVDLTIVGVPVQVQDVARTLSIIPLLSPVGSFLPS